MNNVGYIFYSFILYISVVFCVENFLLMNRAGLYNDLSLAVMIVRYLYSLNAFAPDDDNKVEVITDIKPGRRQES